jgi:hypothetical protein
MIPKQSQSTNRPRINPGHSGVGFRCLARFPRRDDGERFSKSNIFSFSDVLLTSDDDPLIEGAICEERSGFGETRRLTTNSDSCSSTDDSEPEGRFLDHGLRTARVIAVEGDEKGDRTRGSVASASDSADESLFRTQLLWLFEK